MKTRPTWTFLALLASCGGADGRLEPRFVAVHNAMTAMGLAQTGPISEGSLPQGADARIDVDLAAGECTTFVALGTSQVLDLNIRVLDEAGEEIGQDVTHDRQAATQVCPDRAGRYVVVVEMAAGHGGYTMSSWSGTVRGGGAIASGSTGRVSGGGTCESPRALTAGRPVQGTTRGGASRTQGTCAQGDAPERVYRLELSERSQVRAVVESSYDGALYIQSTCGRPDSEVVCNDDQPNTERSEVATTLAAGTYYLIVDGYGSEQGDYELIVEIAALQPLAAVCGGATALAVGRPVSGSTQGQPDYFRATCAGGAPAPDRVYRLEVQQRSRLRVSQQSDHDGALYVRSQCDDPTTEIACNDDYGDNRHSLLTTVLDPGTYFVYADGFDPDQSGNYTLSAELVSDSGGGANGDACSGPGTAAAGQVVAADTFEAGDELAGTCGGGGAPDVVYQLDVRARSRLRANAADAQFDGVMYLQRACGAQNTELACVQTAASTPATLSTVLTPGRYFLVIDGQRADAFGAVNVDVALDDLAQLERACRRAPILRPGRIINGDTSGQTDDFQASCAGAAQSADDVYRLRLQRRQIVRISLSSQYDGALHMRRDCTDQTTELACNDDQDDNRHSFIEQTLDAGTYYVIVDGFRTGNAGSYTLDVQTSDP